MDVQMPVPSGHEATRLLRAKELVRGNGDHIPVIAMTGRRRPLPVGLSRLGHG